MWCAPQTLYGHSEFYCKNSQVFKQGSGSPAVMWRMDWRASGENLVPQNTQLLYKQVPLCIQGPLLWLRHLRVEPVFLTCQSLP